MGWINMEVAPVLEGGGQEFAFEKSVSLSGAGSSDSILVPDDIQNISVTAQASGGATVCVYTSTDPVFVIKSGSGETWVPWSPGAISAVTGATFFPVTAVKIVQTGSGASKLTVRAQ